MMYARQDILAIFSTFLQFEADEATSWVSDVRLRRNMLYVVSQLGESKKASFWALYWYKQLLRQQSCAEVHLLAYFQEDCYWVAKKIKNSFTVTQYDLPDLFQIAITHTSRILKGFELSQGYALRKYVLVGFRNVIRDFLLQRQEIDICSDWALLRKTSQTRLIEALQESGLDITKFVLAWTCFKAMTATQTTQTRTLSKPKPEVMEAIAQLYNQRRLFVHPSIQPVVSNLIETWLLLCAKAVRSYLYPALLSTSAPQSGEFLDHFTSLSQSSLLEDLIAQEEEQDRQAQRSQINSVLVDALNSLDQQSQAILAFYYQEGLTQQQIASRLEVNQATVSRRLERSRTRLGLALAQWSRDTLHITQEFSVLELTSSALEEWLNIHFTDHASDADSIGDNMNLSTARMMQA